MHTKHRTPGELGKYLDYFFAYTHTWLPLVDKFKVISFAEHTLGDHDWVSLSAQESATLALLWAIIACASPQLPIQEGAALVETISPEAAYRSERSLLPNDDFSYENEHTQALILLSLYKFWRGSWKTSWVLIGQAGRISINIQPASETAPKYQLSSNEKRTSLACFVVEGLIAAYLGQDTQHTRIRSLSTAADMKWQIEEDGWEEWSNWRDPDSSGMKTSGPFRTISTFNQLVQLVESMNTSGNITLACINGTSDTIITIVRASSTCS